MLIIKAHIPTLTTYFALEIQHCLVTHYYYYLKYNTKILITTIEKIKTTFLLAPGDNRGQVKFHS